MNTRSWDRWLCMLAAAAVLNGCGGGAVTSDAGVLTKGQGGTLGQGGVPGMGGAGGLTVGGTGGAVLGGGGVGGHVSGSTGGTADGGTAGATGAGGAEGTADAGMDAPDDVADSATDAAIDGRRDMVTEMPVLVDAPVADTPAVDGPDDDALPTDASAPDMGPNPCPVTTTEWASPRIARSSGYSGTLNDYSDLYDVACTSLQQCKETCMAAGGTADSCTTGSECVTGSTGSARHCLPPTYWRYEDRALEASADWTEAAEQTLVVIAYNDPLVVRDFRVSVPAGATIRGIQFSVRRSADEDTAVDDSIRILRNGQPVGTEHKKADAWPMDLAYTSYGGPADTWGTTWAPADFQAAGFGIAVAAKYTMSNGNARAYVDYVRVRVSFVPATCTSTGP